MTEQEKRIEEMVKIVDEIFNGSTHHSINLIDTTCRILEDAGYRKEEEVRKETAKEILQEIESPYYSVGDVYELTRHDIQELAEKFGVEVEE